MAKPSPFIFGKVFVLPNVKLSIPKFEQTPLLSIDPTFDPVEAKTALIDDFHKVTEQLQALPEAALPDGYAVVENVLRSRFLRPHNYPRELLADLNLTVLGSKYCKIHPRRHRSDNHANIAPNQQHKTISLLVAGLKTDFSSMAERITNLDLQAFNQIASLEAVRILEISEKLKTKDTSEIDDFEVFLQFLPERNDLFPCDHFRIFAESLGFQVLEELRGIADRVIFQPIRGPRANLPKLAEFAFLRHVVEATRLRNLKPLLTKTVTVPDGTSSVETPNHSLATDQKPGQTDGNLTPLEIPPALADESYDPGVAILDGGLINGPLLDPWIKENNNVDPEAKFCEGGPAHGLAVTSAYLFGSLPEHGLLPTPYSKVSFFRILDTTTSHDSKYTMFKTLARIKAIAETGKYRIINVSLGPNLSMDENRISAWSITFDMLAVKHNVLFIIAAGNNGIEHPNSFEALTTARLQIPGDCINHLAVGAVDHQGKGAKKTFYSPYGPGRNQAPKPDVVAYGGVSEHPFRVLDSPEHIFIREVQGTSFASPSIMRTAVGLMVIGGPVLSNQSVKALLIHYADRGDNNCFEVGWGQPPTAEVIADGNTGETRIVFQDKIFPGNRQLIVIPPPEGGWHGRFKLKGTLCYISHVSPLDPANYTLTALEAYLVLNKDLVSLKDGQNKENEESLKIKPFFDIDGEEVNQNIDPEEINLANVRSNEQTLNGDELTAPGFIIRLINYLNPNASPIEFSLVVTIQKI
jgi:hypothetical protein